MSNFIKYLFVGISIAGICACTTMKNVHDKFADLQMQKRQLANGDTVWMNFNLKPTQAWACNQVAVSPRYNWAWLKMKAPYNLSSSPYSLLIDNSLDYANQQHLKTNYITLVIPNEMTLNNINLHPSAKAFAEYYQCAKINPEHNLGAVKKTAIGVG